MYESLFPWHHIHTLSPVRCFSSLSPADLNDYIHILPLFRPALWLYRTDLWQCMSSHKCCRHHRSHRMADPSCYKYRWSFRPVRLSVLWVVPSDCNDKLLHFPVRPSLSSAGSACRTLYCLYFRRRLSVKSGFRFHRKRLSLYCPVRPSVPRVFHHCCSGKSSYYRWRRSSLLSVPAHHIYKTRLFRPDKWSLSGYSACHIYKR